MTPDESLALISEMINNLKEDYKNNAYYFILWGWTITLASISHFILLLLLHRFDLYSMMGLSSMLIWVLFVGVAILIQYIHLAKHKPRNSSLYNRVIKALWLAAGINMAVIITICIKFEIYPPVLILPVVGMATLIMGLMMHFKPLIAGGFLFFTAALIAAFWLYEYSLIVNAVAIILGYLIPGYMLRKAKSESHV